MTETELRDPVLLTVPLKPSDWQMRQMVLEHDRRESVLHGRPDPRPGEPWRICSASDIKNWIMTHQRRRPKFMARAVKK